MDKLVLVTRPMNQAVLFAEQVRVLGGMPIIVPLLTIAPIPVLFGDYDIPDVIIVTSSHAATGLDIPPAWLKVPAIAVGDQSAQSLRDAGFLNVTSLQGRVADMVAYLRGLPPQNIVYLRGREITCDVVPVLPHHRFSEIITYEAQESTGLPQAVLDVFGELHTITIFSSRSAQTLARLMRDYQLGSVTKSINLLSLSPQMLECCDGFEWKSCQSAVHPDQAGLTQMLRQLLEDKI